jgi:uncharacterized protein YjlB
MEKINFENLEIQQLLLKDDGVFPNNNQLPVLLYRHAINFSGDDPAADTEKLFRRNKWKNNWRAGIYHFHHYHSTAHELLGVYGGSCKVQLGGENGPVVNISKGDVLLIPAGVAHKSAGNSADFKCVGAYPPGQKYDMKYGDTEERDEALQNIRKLSLPATDPVTGKEGAVLKYWKKKKTAAKVAAK